jgi:hypothetical protein
MFRHRQQLRRWAACVLLLWWFGVGVGIANACLTAGPAVPGPTAGSPVVALLDAHHSVGSHDPAGAEGIAVPSHHVDGAVHPDSPAKTNCQDFCEKATLSLAPLKSVLDDVQSHVAIAAATVTVLPASAMLPAPLWVPCRDGGQAPPIPIAFLRLAL